MEESKLQEDHQNLNFPDYQDIVKEIKTGLSERAGLVARRTLFAFWPGLFLFLPLFILWAVLKFEIISQTSLSYLTEDVRFYVFLVIIFLFATLYSLITSHILFIEKVIWIDSYFDKRKITPDDSLRISKKLFFPTFKFKLVIFIKYYLLPSVIFLLLLSGVVTYLYATGNPSSQFNSPYVLTYGFYLIIGFAIGSLILGFYSFYYLKIRLRYVWFIFLDNYTTQNFFYPQLFKEIKELNGVKNKEAFRRLLAIHLGSDLMTDITRSATSFLFSEMIGQKNKTSGVATDLLSGYASGLLTEMGDYGKNIADYILYRYARSYLYGESQKMNAAIYSLI